MDEDLQPKSLPLRTEELTIECGNEKIYGRLYLPKEGGAHPAVILSHGYNGSNLDFKKECLFFAQNGYIAYAYDFCGGSVMSKSSGKTTDMTIFTQKENLLAVLDCVKNMKNVDSEKIFLFGASQGGLATALAAEEAGRLVKGVILYYPAFCIPDDWRGRYGSVDEIPETVEFWGMDLGRKYFESIHDFYVFKNIGTYDKNVLIIHGGKDSVVGMKYIKKAQKSYKNARLIVLDGEEHGFSAAGAKKAMKEALEFMKNQ